MYDFSGWGGWVGVATIIQFELYKQFIIHLIDSYLHPKILWKGNVFQSQKKFGFVKPEV